MGPFYSTRLLKPSLWLTLLHDCEKIGISHNARKWISSRFDEVDASWGAIHQVPNFLGHGNAPFQWIGCYRVVTELESSRLSSAQPDRRLQQQLHNSQVRLACTVLRCASELSTMGCYRRCRQTRLWGLCRNSCNSGKHRYSSNRCHQKSLPSLARRP